MKLILPLLMYKEEKGKQKWVTPTVNHVYTHVNNRRFLDKWGKQYKSLIYKKATEWVEQTGWEKSVNQKLVMNVSIYWSDARKRDPDNISKVLLDALQPTKIFDDDCNVLLRFIDFDIDPFDPRVEITFEKKEKFDRKKRVEQLKKRRQKNDNDDR